MCNRTAACRFVVHVLLLVEQTYIKARGFICLHQASNTSLSLYKLHAMRSCQCSIASSVFAGRNPARKTSRALQTIRSLADEHEH